MAENSTLDNRAINDLYLTNGIMEDGLRFLIYTTNLNMMLPLLIITVLYMCCKLAIDMHIKRCTNCTDLTPTGAVCEQSKTIKVRFCRIIKRWTVWLLVDLFRTPNVGKEMENNKVHLKLWGKRSLVLGKKVIRSALLFFCISVIFSLYIEKFLVDFFLKLTPTCISKGDFGTPAACYALNTSYFANSSTSQIRYQINCTTWNDNLESLGEEIGLLFCFSFYYNILTSVTEMIGLFGLQTVVVQLTLIIAENCTHLVDKCTQRVTEQMCKLVWIGIFIYIISLVGYIFICFIIPMLTVITDPMNIKRTNEVMYQQFLPTQITFLSMILPMLLMLLTDKDGKTTEETCKMTHDRQRNHVTETRMEEQIDGETDIFVIEKGRSTWYQSQDERSFETMQMEDITSVEIHNYTPEEACRQHDGGRAIERI